MIIQAFMDDITAAVFFVAGGVRAQKPRAHVAPGGGTPVFASRIVLRMRDPAARSPFRTKVSRPQAAEPTAHPPLHA